MYEKPIKGDKVQIGDGTYEGYLGTIVSVKDSTATVRLKGGQDCETGERFTISVDDLVVYHRPPRSQ